ncbi:Cell division trigger factor [Lachnospiraceae bacterium TWA4]|nr:Cell division trigger factor [Lachnospiraceae bacterium TWA4]
MSVQVENLEKNMAKLIITVDAKVVDDAMEAVYKKNKSKYSVPGFRKGKVSRKMMENLYGKGIFLEDAINSILPTEYEKAVEESGVDVVSEPELNFTQTEPGKDLVFEATVAVKPEVKLGQYKGVEVKKVVVEVTDDDVMKVINSEREKNGVTVNVEDRPVKDGDNTTIDFEGFIDGVAFEGGKGTDYPLTIGSNAFIPGFESQLVGAELNKEVEINVTFPEDYHSEELKGKAAMFKVTVKKIEETQLPEVDDEFASEVSEFETLADYKEDVRKNLLERRTADAAIVKQNEAVSKAAANAEMEIPEAMVNTEAKNLVRDMAQNMQSQGLTMEMYLQYTGQTEEAVREQMKPRALEQIRTSLVVEAVAKAEGIEATEEEINEQYELTAKAYQMEVEELKNMTGEAYLESLKNNIVTRKAAELIAAESVEVEVEEVAEEAKDAE